MIQAKKISSIGILFFLSVLANATLAFTEIASDNPFLQYSGRIDFSQPKSPFITWPGSSVTGRFTGTHLGLRLDDQLGKNFFNVFIDGDYSKPIIIQCEKGEKDYVIATDLRPGKHSFLLYKRTEGQEGGTFLKHITLNDNQILLAPPKRQSRKIEFFGDSITSGAGNEAADDGLDSELKDKNNFWTYGAVAARALNADAHIISQSGIGVMISWFPFIMPQFYDQLSAVGDNDTHWDFSTWTPDVVVINLLQNDSWLIDREHRLTPEPSHEQRVQAYLDFVTTIRSKYPNAYIICALGSMDATKKGSVWPSYVSKAVAKMKSRNPDEKIDTLFFDYTGYDRHPRIKQHKENAEKLTALIKQKMHW